MINPRKIKCLILDHDDTAVNSTATIHYPAHLQMMKELRPRMNPVTLEEWFLKNFDPGIMEFLKDELKLNEDEIQKEYILWQSFTEKIIPDFFPGFLDILNDFKNSGGHIAVISHSEDRLIRRDYTHHTGVAPELIYGWDFDKEKRKPHPYPVKQILKHYGLKPEEALIVDDLKPAVDMGRASGVPVAGSGWAHNIKPIREYMQRNCAVYFPTVKSFGDFVIEGKIPPGTET